MFSLFKPKPATDSNPAALLGADMHSHLLPGIDDGSPDMATTVDFIRELQQLGYQKLITTPHILWDLYKNTRPLILEKAALVKEALHSKGIAIEFAVAAEYFMDDYFNQLLKSGEPLLTLKDNWVLVEFSFVSEPYDLAQNLFDLEINGYLPVIAHPERYAYFHQRKERLHELFDRGYLLQLNLLSLTGYYGRAIQEMGAYLLRNKMIRLFGTDLHHYKHLHALQDKDLFKKVREAVDSGLILNPEL